MIQALWRIHAVFTMFRCRGGLTVTAGRTLRAAGTRTGSVVPGKLSLASWSWGLVVEAGEGTSFDGRPQNLLNITDQDRVFLSDQSERVSRMKSSAGTPDAMGVGVRCVRDVIVDDVRDLRHIDAASRNVGSDQYLVSTVAKATQCCLACALRQIALQRRRSVAFIGQLLAKLLGTVLGARKDEDRLRIRMLQQLDEQRRLEVLRYRVESMRNRFYRSGVADLDCHGVMQDSIGQMTDVLRHGGAVQQVLALGREVLDDAADVGQEAHVQHHVRFVEDEDLDLGEVDCTLADMVQQTARAGDGNVDAAPERIDLWIDADAAVDGENSEASLVAQVAEVLGDLLRQFAGWGHDEGTQRTARPSQQAFHDRKCICGRLACSGLGKTHNVTSFHDRGNTLLLDGCGCGIAA